MLARLQQFTTLAGLFAALLWGWVAWTAGRPGWAIAGAALVVGGYALVLGLEFAAARFAQKGFHPTSVAEIVEGIGVGKGVFYWYFDTKESLLRAILADAQRDLRRRQRAAISDGSTPMERIERGIRASIQWSVNHTDHFRLVQFAATDDRFSPWMAAASRHGCCPAPRRPSPTTPASTSAWTGASSTCASRRTT